jgi:hypothetical protein
MPTAGLRALPVNKKRGPRMKRIRVAVPNSDDCMRCERALDDAAIPFDLMPHPEALRV